MGGTYAYSYYKGVPPPPGQIFSGEGTFLNAFGNFGCLDHQLKYPRGLSVDTEGNCIVADLRSRLIKIFSPGGQFLRKFGGDNTFVDPYHCIQHGQYFIVSDCGDHCIKYFDLEGNFLFKAEKEGFEDGEFNEPCYLSVNKEGRLMDCVSENHRIQVFELGGKFVTKFGKQGTGMGEFNKPVSTAVLSDGRIFVSDLGNTRVQIFDHHNPGQ